MLNVLYILWLRQLKRYYRSRSRLVGALGQPLLFLFALGYGLGPVFQRAGSGNYIQFLVPGVIAQTILFTSIFSGIEIIFDKQFGFLKETLVAPVSRVSIMIGRTLGGATTALLQGFIVLVVSLFMGFRFANIWLIPFGLIFMFLIAILFTSVGIAIASLVDDVQGFQLIVNFLVMPLFFLSGALFPLQGIPSVLKLIASLDPLSYGIDGMRTVFLHTTAYSLTADYLVLGVATVAVVAFGSYLFSRVQV